MPQIEVMNASPVFFWMICFVSVTALAISKSGFGGALGSLSMPIMLFVLPPKLALGVLLLDDDVLHVALIISGASMSIGAS